MAHGYSHFGVRVGVYRCVVTGDPSPSGPWNAFHHLAPEEREAYGLTGVARKALEAVGWVGNNEG